MIGKEDIWKNIWLPDDLFFVSSKIRKIREVLKMSQEEFGKKTNTNQRTVSYFEGKFRKITTDFICKLVLDIKVNPYWLLWDDSRTTKANLSTIVKFMRTLWLVNDGDTEWSVPDGEILINDFCKPNQNGELNIFLPSASIDMRDKLDNFIYNNEKLKQQAIIILNEIEEFKPTLARMYDKIDELKEILSKL